MLHPQQQQDSGFTGYHIATIESLVFTGSLNIGEAKIRILPRHINIDADLLPVAIWFKTTTTNSFGTFKEGDVVVVEFQDGNNPIIRGRMFTQGDKDAISAMFPEYESDYPNVHGWADGSNGVMWNRATGEMKVISGSGTNFSVSSGGDLSGAIKGDLTATVDGDIAIEGKGSGSIKTKNTLVVEVTTGNLELKAPMIMEN